MKSGTLLDWKFGHTPSGDALLLRIQSSSGMVNTGAILIAKITGISIGCVDDDYVILNITLDSSLGVENIRAERNSIIGMIIELYDNAQIADFMLRF